MKYLLDIEVFPNIFYVAIREFDKDVQNFTLKEYEISEHKDDRYELYKFLAMLETSKTKNFIITFNGVHYDLCVLGYIFKNFQHLKDESVKNFTFHCKHISDSIINEQEDSYKLKYIFKNNNFIQIDLFLYWAKLLRLSKKISLKGLGIQMGYPVVQELPYSPHTNLTKEQIEDVKIYCREHDLGILSMLFENKLEDIKLRQSIVSDYKINAWSYDAPKIASEALLLNYCKKTGRDPKSVSKLRFERDTIVFKDILSDIPFSYKTEPYISVYNEWLGSINTFSKEFNVFSSNPNSRSGVKISLGVGGVNLCPLYK